MVAQMEGPAAAKLYVSNYLAADMPTRLMNYRNTLLVDDSIVRGTTCNEIIQMARDAGAKKVYFASAAPMVKYPNVYGIDMPAKSELIASDRTVEEIREIIGRSPATEDGTPLSADQDPKFLAEIADLPEAEQEARKEEHAEEKVAAAERGSRGCIS